MVYCCSWDNISLLNLSWIGPYLNIGHHSLKSKLWPSKTFILNVLNALFDVVDCFFSSASILKLDVADQTERHFDSFLAAVFVYTVFPCEVFIPKCDTSSSDHTVAQFCDFFHHIAWCQYIKPARSTLPLKESWWLPSCKCLSYSLSFFWLYALSLCNENS